MNVFVYLSKTPCIYDGIRQLDYGIQCETVSYQIYFSSFACKDYFSTLCILSLNEYSINTLHNFRTELNKSWKHQKTY